MKTKKVQLKQTVLPRWKGFNLTDCFSDISKKECYREDDFKFMQDYGFDFARIPVTYTLFSSIENPFNIDMDKLSMLDNAVYNGIKHNVHVNICMHRLPGYCINPNKEGEVYDLWENKSKQEASAFIWRTIAERYKDISDKDLSFNFVNEPDLISLKAYFDTAKQSINEIRKISPNRLIILDGMIAGETPPIDLVMMEKENIAFSCRGYIPHGLTHYKVFPPYDKTEEPVWPNAKGYWYDDLRTWNKEELDKLYSLWAFCGNNYNIGIHCGELGCNSNTPHKVFLSWLTDLLDILKSHNIGFAVWGLHGHTGIFNTNFPDCEYVDFAGKKLDIKMLKILEKY